MITQINYAVPLAESVFEPHRHICVFYHSDDEQYRAILPFIKEGFDRGDKIFQIIDADHRQEHLRRLQEAGIDVTCAESEGRVEVRGWENAHLRLGWFDQHLMLALVEEVLARARNSGFPFTRWVANMGWALQDVRGSDDLVEYCTRLNHVVPKYDATVVCTYDCARFSARTLIDVLRCHPVAIIGSIMQVNPFFVPPEEFLHELHQRKGHESAA